MAWPVPAEAGSYPEAVRGLTARTILTDEERKQIPVEARARAFWVAGVSQLDLVQQMLDSLGKATAKGETLAEWKKSAKNILRGSGSKLSDAHLATVFTNAMQTAYNFGRWEQMNSPSVARFRPYGLVDAVVDARTTPYCKSVDGTLLLLTDPWWDAHYFPAHHNCRTSIRNIREREARRKGITKTPPDDTPSPGFGQSPRVANPWTPSNTGRNAGLLAELERKRAEMAKATPPPPPIPKKQAATKPPAARSSVATVGGGRFSLNDAQQASDVNARWLRERHENRVVASYEERRDWYMWEWAANPNGQVAVLTKRAAVPAFQLEGMSFLRGQNFAMQHTDLVRARRDLEKLHKSTQAGYRRRSTDSVKLYRGVSGSLTDTVQSIEVWTSDRTLARETAKRGQEGRVQTKTFKVDSILAHHESPGWVDGVRGDEFSHLVIR